MIELPYVLVGVVTGFVVGLMDWSMPWNLLLHDEWLGCRKADNHT